MSDDILFERFTFLPRKFCRLSLLLLIWFMILSTDDFLMPNNEHKAILQTIISFVFKRIL